MNWTGGQLRRHSTRPGVLSKTQRQNFAKSRHLTSCRASAQQTPFRRLPGESSRDDTEELAQANQATKSGEPRSSRDLLDDGLSVLKRRLLQQPDWAAVAVARPLEIKFASVEEVGRVAKRRKLTDLDRKRLSAHGNLTLPESFISHKRRLPSSESIGLGQVKIRIDGRLAGSPSDNTHALPTNNPSSYSILLDSEPPLFFQPDSQASSPVLPWTIPPAQLSLQPSYNGAPTRLEEPEFLPKTPAAEHFGLTGYSSHQTVTSKVSSPYRSRVETDRGTSIASFSKNTADLPLPRRHFTIDDQLLEGQTRFTITSESSPRLQPRSSRSPRQAPSPSPTLIMAGASFKRMVSSWLPQPQRMSLPKSPLNPHSSFANRIKSFRPTIDEAPCSSSSSLSLEVTETSARPVSVKIFGQVVQL